MVFGGWPLHSAWCFEVHSCGRKCWHCISSVIEWFSIVWACYTSLIHHLVCLHLLAVIINVMTTSFSGHVFIALGYIFSRENVMDHIVTAFCFLWFILISMHRWGLVSFSGHVYSVHWPAQGDWHFPLLLSPLWLENALLSQVFIMHTLDCEL